jgi:hypothetical protein
VWLEYLLSGAISEKLSQIITAEAVTCMIYSYIKTQKDNPKDEAIGVCDLIREHRTSGSSSSK